MAQANNRYDSTRQAWEDIWSNADVESELHTLHERRAFEQLAVYPAFLSKEGFILEAGSGLGAVVIYLKQHGFKMLGLDYATNALRAARQYDAALDVQAGDVHALPYRANSLHGYLSFGVLEHFEHGMGPALDEAYRVLVPGGVVVLTIPYPNLVHKLVDWKRRLLGQSQLTNDEFYESTYTQHELRGALEAAGFKVILVRPTSHAFTLWGLGGPFRKRGGYYQTTWLADRLGDVLRAVLPWAFNFTTMVIAQKSE